MEKYSFDNFIMQCCKSKEWDLRNFLKRTLIKAGFQIKEDDFVSYRDGKYKEIRNMLAIRGNPNVCLVAHTDVCRDHAYGAPDVEPVIRSMWRDGEERQIIQDKNCSFQVGGDDRLGVAINTWIALNTGYDLGMLFTTDEEIGIVSAEYVKFPELLNFDLLVEVDRGNHKDQLVNSIGGWELCGPTTTKRLLKIADEIGLPRYAVNGMMTDVLAFKTNHMCKEAVNLTCGYHNSYGADKTEYIDIQEAKDTMKYVSSIVKYYYLNEDIVKEINEEIDFDLDEDIQEVISSESNRGASNDIWDEESYKRDRRGSSYFNDEDEYRGDWPRYMY